MAAPWQRSSVRSAKVRPSEHLQTAGRLTVPAGLEQILPWPRPGWDFNPQTTNINQSDHWLFIIDYIDQQVNKSDLGQRIRVGRSRTWGQYECLACHFNWRLLSVMSPCGQAAWLMSPTATDPSVQLQLTWVPPGYKLQLFLCFKSL